MRIELTTLRLWDLRAADCAIVALSMMVHQWRHCTLMRHSGVTLLSSYLCAAFGWLLFFPSSLYYCDKKFDKWGPNSRLKIMRLLRCRLRHCRCLLYGASVKSLEPCTLMRHSGITLLSSYFLCCFWLALVFPLLPVLLWQKVRQVRIELTTLRLWDLRAADCAIVAVSVMVHQWSYWSLVHWCGIPE